jgi:hypothetical protein
MDHSNQSAEQISFDDLFNLDDIQRLQDEFAQATGVASIITKPDGTPITQPSNWCRLCKIIRKTEKGLINCYKSDATIGYHKPSGPIIQPMARAVPAHPKMAPCCSSDVRFDIQI